MLQTMLHKVSGQPLVAEDVRRDVCIHNAGKELPSQPPLFCSMMNGKTADALDDHSAYRNNQMRSYIPEKGNHETFFSYNIDRMNFHNLFKLYSRFGNPKKTSETITLSNSDKWLRQAKILDNKRLSTSDTGIYFKQIAKSKKSLDIKEYEKYLDFIASKKNMNPERMKFMLMSSGKPKPCTMTRVETQDSELKRSEEKRPEYRWEIINGRALKKSSYFEDELLSEENEDYRSISTSSSRLYSSSFYYD